MKRIVYLVCLLMATTSQAATTMSRVVAINDSHTITVEAGGRRATVALEGIEISPAEEVAATEYLHRLLDGAWVYVEQGRVYRSPDGLYVNAELQRHAWRSSHSMRYLGEVNPGPRLRAQAARAPARPRSHAQMHRPRRRPRSARAL